MLLGLSPVIAWVMIGGKLCKSRLVKLDAAFFDIINHEVKNRGHIKFFECFGIIFFKTRPGRQIGVASFRA